MFRNALAIAAAGLVLIAGATGSPRALAVDPPGKAAADEPVVVSLRLTVEQYDPESPAGDIVCRVENRSDAPIRLPQAYDGAQVVLRSGALRLWSRPALTAALKKQAQGEATPTVELASGESAELFKLSLAEILTDVEKRGGDYGWNWMRRPEPPVSPIRRWREPGYLPSANFYVDLRAMDRTFRSNKVELTVKTPSSE